MDNELKHKLLELLEEDNLFKQQVISLLLPNLLSNLTTKDEIIKILEEIRTLREDFNRAREDSNKRFEEMQKQIHQLREDSNRRFEQMQNQIHQLRGDSNRRFEEMQNQIEQMQKQIQEMQNQIYQLREDFNKQNVYFDTRIERLGSRWGKHAEKTFRTALIDILKRKLNQEVIRWYFNDKKGAILSYACDYEIDVVIKNEEHWLFEIKARIDYDDISRFIKIVEVYKQKEKAKNIKTFVISPYIEQQARKLIKKYNIEIYSI